MAPPLRRNTISTTIITARNTAVTTICCVPIICEYMSQLRDWLMLETRQIACQAGKLPAKSLYSIDITIF
jgi:hypothetical protein